MKMKILKDESNELVIEFETTDITIPDLIASQLQQNDDVEFAGAAKDHPEVGKPRLVIKTDKRKAKEALQKALEELDETIAELKSGVSGRSKA